MEQKKRRRTNTKKICSGYSTGRVTYYLSDDKEIQKILETCNFDDRRY